jgi:hypothetical protein
MRSYLLIYLTIIANEEPSAVCTLSKCRMNPELKIGFDPYVDVNVYKLEIIDQ